MDVKLPQLAEGVESGTVVSILVSEGDRVAKDQPIMELETQKAVGSIPSPESGTVTKIHVKEGMDVAVGQVLISIATESAAKAPETPPEKEQAAPGPLPAAKPEPPSEEGQAGVRPAAETADYRYESRTGFPPPAAPSIRKIARAFGIDLTRVKGSEAGGRITVEDVRSYIQRLQRAAFEARPTAAKAAPAPRAQSPDFARWGPIRRERLSSLRRTVGQRMVESWTSIPKINQFDEADITGLLALRKKYAPQYEKKGAHLTLTPFILKAAVAALKKHPMVNASLDEGSGEIVYKDYYHIGVAVDTEAGLIVPVLRDVNKKGLPEITPELGALTERTRQRKVALEDLQGGTFTISNQGSIGSGHFTPIIYAPQVAILGVGQGAPRPVAIKKRVEVRTLLPLCLAYDHRVLDGGAAVRFLKDVIAGLESFPEGDVKWK